ncbi:MAG: hypothetical protein PF904_15085 [Kiritimatiellae bacterium]|nr:hypothetical protein [Kiritimatiellia bacterium]
MFLTVLVAISSCVCFVSISQADDKTNLVSRILTGDYGSEWVLFNERKLCEAPQMYATFGEYADEEKFIYPEPGARLCKINLKTKEVKVLLEDPDGIIRDSRLHYSGKKAIFGYRKGGARNYHLYEINIDGTGLKQLTNEKWDDFDPVYLPDGGIIFASGRCNRFIPCNRIPTANLYRMNGDGSGIHSISANVLLEDRPAVLPDGRIAYTRWDYLDKAPESFRDLWAMNPDGTDQALLFGGKWVPYPNFYAQCDAMPIPGSRGKIVSIFSPAFGQRENAGNVKIIDMKAGPNNLDSARQINKTLPDLKWTIGSGYGRTGYRDPYPLSEELFFVAKDKSLFIMDGKGETQGFYTADIMVHDPVLIRSRPREPVIPSQVDWSKDTGNLLLANIYHGRNMKGVKQGSIKKILILEDLPKPGSKHGWPGEHGSYITVRRVLGEVPVESDGSAFFEVPALRAIYFVALDESGRSVKRMQNFTMVMPGEVQGCIGCHESRISNSTPAGFRKTLLAAGRAPSKIVPVKGSPGVYDYPRDIQPIWNKHCTECHNSDEPKGHVNLSGDLNEWRSQSYYALHAYGQLSRPGSWGQKGDYPPYGFGTGASKIFDKLSGEHHDIKVSQAEYDKIRLWIETSAIYSGTYAVFNQSDCAVGQPLTVSRYNLGKPVAEIVKRRCVSCHKSEKNIGKRRWEQEDDKWTDSKPPEWLNNPLYCFNLYNLSCPEKSMILKAPMVKSSGGYGWCKGADGKSIGVFKDSNDPDYQTLLKAISAAKVRMEVHSRPGLPNYKPGEYYVRWIRRFGALPADFDLTKDPIDVYKCDQRYWETFWYQAH